MGDKVLTALIVGAAAFAGALGAIALVGHLSKEPEPFLIDDEAMARLRAEQVRLGIPPDDDGEFDPLTASLEEVGR